MGASRPGSRGRSPSNPSPGSRDRSPPDGPPTRPKAHITWCDFPINECRMALLCWLGFTANGFDPYRVAE